MVDASFVRIFDSAGSLTSQEYRCMSPDHPGIPYATFSPKNGTNLDPGFRCNVQFTYDIGEQDGVVAFLKSKRILLSI